MSLTRAAALVVSAATALATAVAVAPAASAQSDSVTSTVPVTYACTNWSESNSPNMTPDEAGSLTNNYSVTAPDTVAPGEFFTVVVQPGPMQALANNRTGRLTWDLAIPDNVTGLSFANAGGNTGTTAGSPAAIRVDRNTKNTNTNGMAIRSWGGSSAEYGQGSGRSVNSGLQVISTAGPAFRLPAITMTMRAPTTPGTPIAIELAGSNEGDNPANASQSQLGFVRHTSNSGNGTQQSCATANPALKTITTTDGPVAELPSTTTMTGGDRTVDSSIPTTIQAQVSANNATSAEIAQGPVTFWAYIDGSPVNLGVGAPTGATNTFAITHSFDRVPDGQPDKEITVWAAYGGSGPAAFVAPSDASPATYTLTAKPTVDLVTNFNVTAVHGAITDEALPVTVTSTFARPNPFFPAETMAQLHLDGAPVGEPVDLSEVEGTSINWGEFELPRGQQTQTHRFTVEFQPVWVDYFEWTGVTNTPAPVIVAGLGQSEPSTGSLNMGSLNMNAVATQSLSDSLGKGDLAPLSTMLPTLSAAASGS